MAFTKVLGPGIHTQANILSHNINSSGIITATKFVGPITGGGGDFNAGIVTCTTLDVNGNADISGNLVVHGDTTTLNTTLREVELLHVDANSSVAAGIITQRGSGDILNLFDTSTEVFTVLDGGKVGIGYNAPPTKLSIRGTSASTDATVQIVGNSVSTLLLGQDADGGVIRGQGGNNALKFKVGGGGDTAATTGGTEALRINSAGEVGIGTDNPVTSLEVYRDDNASKGIIQVTQDGTGDAAIDFQLKGTKEWTLGIDNSDGDNFKLASSAGLASNARITVTTAGKVGIGTDSPLGTLDIFNANADASNTNSLGAQINAAWIRIGDVDAAGKTFSNGLGTKLYNQGTAHWSYGMLGQDFLITNTSGDGNKLFPSNRSTHFFIKSDGKVGIGTESPGVELEIKGTDATLLRLDSSNAQGTTFRIRNSGTDKMYMGLAADFITGQSGNVTDSAIRASGHLIVASGGGTERLRIKSDGNLKVPDNAKIELGGAQTVAGDFQIYHDTVHTYLKNRHASGYTLLQVNDDEYGIKIQPSGFCQLYHANVLKLSTSTTGITVTGEVAASQDYPDIRPRLDFNFTSVKKLDPRFTYTRTGPASYVDEFGIVKLVGYNVPRFDHDPMTGECKGLLIEDSKVNNNKVATNEWNATGWTSEKTNLEHYPSETAPDESTNVTLVYPTTHNDNHYHYISHAGNSYSGSRTCSAWFKKLSTTTYFPQLRIFGAGSGKAHAVFTLTGDGSVTSGGNATTNATITRYPNDWYYCTLSWTYASGHYGGGIVIGNDSSTELPTFTGDSDKTKGYLMWGFQDEVGLFPTSLVPTDGITRTRSGDKVSITGEEHTDFWNPTEGTYLIDYKPIELAVGDGVIIGSKRGTQGSGYPWPLYRHDTANSNIFKSYDLDNGIVSISSAWANQRESWALGFNGTNGSIVRNGTQLQTNNANMNGLINVTELWLGSSSTGSYYSMHVKRFIYYAKRITDSQLITLTS